MYTPVSYTHLDVYKRQIKPSEELYCQSQILAYEGLSIEYYDDYTIPYKKELAGTCLLYTSIVSK